MWRNSWTAMVCTLVACGGGSDGGSGPVAVHDLADALKSAYCDYFVRCSVMPDKASCMASTTYDTTSVRTVIADVDAGLIKYDADLAGQCVDDIRNDGCTVSSYRVDACQGAVFQGIVGEGGACANPYVCVETGACVYNDPMCDLHTSCCAGTCTVAPRAPLGGDCSLANCPRHAFCDPATNKCTAEITVEGEPCTGSGQCTFGLYCALGSMGTAGTCKRYSATGATCDPQNVRCDDVRDFCDATTLKCTRRIAVDGTCDPSMQQCVGYATCVNGRCTTDIAVDQPCTTGTGPNCLGDAACTNGTCTLASVGLVCP